MSSGEYSRDPDLDATAGARCIRMLEAERDALEAQVAGLVEALERLVNATTPLIGEPCVTCGKARPNHDEGCSTLLGWKALQALPADCLTREARRREREEALRSAAAAFIAKLDAIMPAVNDAFFFQENHGFPYKGDTWGTELTRLRDALHPELTPPVRKEKNV